MYFGFPEDGDMTLKHEEMLCYVMYDFRSFCVHLFVTVITCKNNARTMSGQT